MSGFHITKFARILFPVFTGCILFSASAYAQMSIKELASQGWIRTGRYARLGNHFYVLEDMNECGLYSWEELLDYCKQNGGYPAVISSQLENEALYELISSQGYRSAFFGYTDRYQEGNWVWEGNEDSSYTNWSPGQPNNKTSKSHPEGEHYVQFDKGANGTWNDAPFRGNTAQFILEYVDNETYEDTSNLGTPLFYEDEAEHLMYRYAEAKFSNSVGAYWDFYPIDYWNAPNGSEKYYCYSVTSFTGAAGIYYLNKYDGDVLAQWAPPHHSIHAPGYVWEEPQYEINLVEWLNEADNDYDNNDSNSIEVSGYLGRTVAEVMEAFPDLAVMGEDGVGLFGDSLRFDVKLTGKEDLGQEVISCVYVYGEDTQYMIHGLKPGVDPDEPYAEADCVLEPAGSTEYWDEDDNVIVLFCSWDENSPNIYYYDPDLRWN